MRREINIGFIIALASVFISTVSCSSPEDRWKGTITTDERGVRVVRNPKEPLYRANIISLEEELTIKGGQGEQMFMNLVSIALDRDGLIYLLDARAGNIKVYGDSGQFQRVIGRRGQGPGEFGGPERLAITPQDEIMVSDPARRLIHFLDLAGRYLRQIPQNMPFFSGPKFLSNGDMVASYAILGDAYETVLCRFNTDLKPVFTYSSIPMYKLPRVHIFLYHFVHDLQWDISPNDEVVCGVMTAPEYELHVYDAQGKMIKKIIKDYEPIEITGDEYIRLTEKWFGRPPTGGRFDLVVPKHYPPFHTFLADDEGRLFVRRFEEAEKGERIYCEVFDPQGRYLTDIVFPEKKIPALFQGGKIYTREEDEDGYQVVKRYKIKWKF
jgi:hypothetical protein